MLLLSLDAKATTLDLFKFEHVVAIEPQVGIILDTHDYRIWDIDTKWTSQPRSILADFNIDQPIEFAWVPYIPTNHQNVSEEDFALKYGHICLRSVRLNEYN